MKLDRKKSEILLIGAENEENLAIRTLAANNSFTLGI
jgi:hypothetical protein